MGTETLIGAFGLTNFDTMPNQYFMLIIYPTHFADGLHNRYS